MLRWLPRISSRRVAGVLLGAGCSAGAGGLILYQTDPSFERSVRFWRRAGPIVAHYFLERWRGSDDADRAARYQRLHVLYAPEARKVMQELRGMFVKVAQVLSVRPEAVPEEYRNEFRKLQDCAPPARWDPIRHVLERDLGAPVMENFQFDWKGSLAPRRETGAEESVLFVDWKASLIPVRPVEVRNTFVHFEEDEDQLRKASQSRRTASSPPELRTAGTVREEEPGEIANCAVQPEASDCAADACNENSEECGTTSCSTDVPEKVAAADTTLHQLGQCRPCAYFRMKADGCQKGDACEFCHLCTSEDVRAKQILYKRQVRAQKRAAASQAKHCQIVDREQVFDQIDQEPLGAASIGQAHRVVWQGRPAVVKVQYPDAAAMLRADFRCLELLLWLVSQDALAIMSQVRHQFATELDYESEANHLRELHAAFQVAPQFKGKVVLPEPIPELTSGHVIGMGYLEGSKLELALRTRLEALGVDLGKQGIGEWLAAQQRNGLSKNFSLIPRVNLLL
eukprot:s2_g62.t2